MPHRLPAAHRPGTPAQHIGRQGAILLFYGLTAVLFGLAYILIPPSAVGTRNLVFALRFLPLHAWGGVWLTIGVIAVVSAFAGINKHKWALTLLLLMFIIWGVAYLSSSIASFLGVINNSAPLSAVVFAVFSFLQALILIVVAGWPEPADNPPRSAGG